METFPGKLAYNLIISECPFRLSVTSKPVHTNILMLYHGEGEVVDEVDEDICEEIYRELD